MDSALYTLVSAISNFRWPCDEIACSDASHFDYLSLFDQKLAPFLFLISWKPVRMLKEITMVCFRNTMYERVFIEREEEANPIQELAF